MDELTKLFIATAIIGFIILCWVLYKEKFSSKKHEDVPDRSFKDM